MPDTSASADPPGPPTERWLNRTVLGAGITSGLCDLTYETGNVILPSFLTVLGLPAAVLGLVEGIADAVSSFTKMAAGFIADRLGHRKTLVVVGYVLTTSMHAFLALAVGWPLILLGRIVGWLGRGIRSPLRDAIMAEAVTPGTRGRAFGFHRAADTVGAVLGPLTGVALLSWAKTLPFDDPAGPFRLVFWWTLVPGVLSVLSFTLLVRDDRSQPNPTMRFWTTLRTLPRSFRQFLGAVGVFGLGDFAPTLLILAATQLLTPRLGVVQAAQVAGLLYAGRNLVTALTSYPVGALGDRWGHHVALTVGYVLGAYVPGMLLLAFLFQIDSVVFLAGVFGVAGLAVSIHDTLQSSLTADYVPREVRGTAYGILGTVNGIGDFVSSAMVGLLWTFSPVWGFACAGLLMLLGACWLGALPEAKRGSSG